ncbi:MAG: hypothetical protein CBC57_06625 [Euryarchaeota archaeon TMED97]|nr:MAG: hypothetical protein CBC57_06625 [Euryarchaeota archaeon TMED97]|tara:strand:- start:105 stop:542 length:438 start_codon:yes stop_codon:yes gene_type:complete
MFYHIPLQYLENYGVNEGDSLRVKYKGGTDLLIEADTEANALYIAAHFCRAQGFIEVPAMTVNFTSWSSDIAAGSEWKIKKEICPNSEYFQAKILVLRQEYFQKNHDKYIDLAIKDYQSTDWAQVAADIAYDEEVKRREKKFLEA